MDRGNAGARPFNPDRRALLAVLIALSGCAVSSTPAFPPAQQAAVERVQAWLDGLHGFEAKFLQVWPNGAVGSGVARFDPPGRLRLDYWPDDSMVLIANQGHVVFTDRRTGSVTRMPARASALGLLVDGRPRLSGPVRVTDVQTPPGALQISLARADNPQAGLLTLTFADRGGSDLVLTGIEAVDAESQRTRLHLTDQRVGIAFPPQIFAL